MTQWITRKVFYTKTKLITKINIEEYIQDSSQLDLSRIHTDEYWSKFRYGFQYRSMLIERYSRSMPEFWLVLIGIHQHWALIEGILIYKLWSWRSSLEVNQSCYISQYLYGWHSFTHHDHYSNLPICHINNGDNCSWYICLHCTESAVVSCLLDDWHCKYVTVH